MLELSWLLKLELPKQPFTLVCRESQITEHDCSYSDPFLEYHFNELNHYFLSHVLCTFCWRQVGERNFFKLFPFLNQLLGNVFIKLKGCFDFVHFDAKILFFLVDFVTQIEKQLSKCLLLKVYSSKIQTFNLCIDLLRHSVCNK